uniref:Reverse transcriptase domain-containing protein n=1 Tax=Paramormyrops kingsleyae TaxID=1676925 RepID=A0A3B3TBN1_9TELE
LGLRPGCDNAHFIFGVRQGCPLSPLLFNLLLEPLAAALRHSDLISPHPSERCPSVSLYADDLLLYLGNAPVDLPHVLNLFQTYESLSGYRINWAKSSLLPLNPSCHSSSLPPSIPQAVSFRYLGLDYPSGIKASISSWSSLPLSFRARLAVKMNVLARINFISSMLPLSPPPGYWASVKSAISTFLWDGKRPSVRHSALIRDRLDGGVSLPDFEIYHLAFTLRPVWSWISPPQHPPAWLPIEAEYALPHLCSQIIPHSPETPSHGLRA